MFKRLADWEFKSLRSSGPKYRGHLWTITTGQFEQICPSTRLALRHICFLILPVPVLDRAFQPVAFLVLRPLRTWKIEQTRVQDRKAVKVEAGTQNLVEKM